jgi:hypothetical protein
MTLSARFKELPKKLLFVRGESQNHPSAAKAAHIFAPISGTDKSVPFQKCEVSRNFRILQGRDPFKAAR